MIYVLFTVIRSEDCLIYIMKSSLEKSPSVLEWCTGIVKPESRDTLYLSIRNLLSSTVLFRGTLWRLEKLSSVLLNTSGILISKSIEGFSR